MHRRRTISTSINTLFPYTTRFRSFKAWGRVGRVVRRSSFPVLTQNRRPVTHAVRTTFSYIDKVQTTALGQSAGVALPSVSVSQREETVGSLLTLVPDAQDDGQILLSVAYDNQVAQPLHSVMFGRKEIGSASCRASVCQYV